MYRSSHRIICNIRAIFTGEHLRWRLTRATLLKRDSSTGVFLQKFLRKPFLQNTSVTTSGCIMYISLFSPNGGRGGGGGGGGGGAIRTRKKSKFRYLFYGDTDKNLNVQCVSGNLPDLIKFHIFD